MTALVRLSPGTGYVARRPAALLYLPRPEPTLLGAFRASTGGDELQAVASATVAAGFDVGPFVAVSWEGAVRVMAFGDVAVETDQPTLPMLTGAGSRTWVEHSLTPVGTATITVGGEGGQLDDATALTEGVVPAGGFELQIGVAADDAAADSATATPSVPPGAPADLPDPTGPAGRPRPPDGDADADADAGQPSAEPDLAAASGAAPAAGGAPSALEPVSPSAVGVDVDDPQAALAAIQAAAVGEDGVPVHRPAAEAPAPAGPVPVPDDPEDPDVTLPPPDTVALLQDLGATQTGRSSLLDAKLCSNEHPNPPTAASCAVCGELLPPGLGTVHVPRPRLGGLRLDDGTVVPLDAEVLIGRNPARDQAPERAQLARVKVPGDKVSRSHLEIRFQGWDVLVADCGSTNGTFIVPHPGGQVVALDANRPQLVEPGATVYFGSRSFTVLGRREA